MSRKINRPKYIIRAGLMVMFSTYFVTISLLSTISTPDFESQQHSSNSYIEIVFNLAEIVNYPISTTQDIEFDLEDDVDLFTTISYDFPTEGIFDSVKDYKHNFIEKHINNFIAEVMTPPPDLV